MVNASECKEMKARIAALANASQANKNDNEEGSMTLFAALRSTLEDIASSTINGSGVDSLLCQKTS